MMFSFLGWVVREMVLLGDIRGVSLGRKDGLFYIGYVEFKFRY